MHIRLPLHQNALLPLHQHTAPGSKALHPHCRHGSKAVRPRQPCTVASRTLAAQTAAGTWPREPHAADAKPAVATAAASTGAATAAATTAAEPPPSVAQYLDFEIVWLDYRQQLSMSKGAAEHVLVEVRAGKLPCDAGLLRSRAEALLRLEGRGVAQASGALNARRLLNEHPDALRYGASHVEAWVRRLPLLLPHLDPTLLLLATLAELQRPLELVAVQYGELDLAFRSMLGTQLPGPLFSHMLQHRLSKESTASALSMDGTAGPSMNQTSNSGSTSTSSGLQLAAPADPQTTAAQQLDSTTFMVQLQALQEVLGPELSYAALRSTPALVGLPAHELSERLLALQRVLRVGHMQALLAAEEHGTALLLPAAEMEQRRGTLVRCLARWAQMDEARSQTLLRRTPSALTWGWEGAALAAQWSKVQHLAQRRRRWAGELAAAPAALVASVLRAPPEALQRLQYLGDSGDRPAVGLRGVLAIREIDFVQTCPGYRRWRLQRGRAPGRARTPAGRGVQPQPVKGREWGHQAATWAQPSHFGKPAAAGRGRGSSTGGALPRAPQPEVVSALRPSRLVRLDDL